MLTGVILTKNEQENLDRCLNSLKFCDSILLIDDNSTDDTIKIAQSHKVKVLTHPLNGNFAAQRNLALSQAPPGWVLFVDADEVVSPQLAQEISSTISLHTLNEGYSIPRVDILWNRQLKHGDLSQVKLLRLAKIGSGSWRGLVHETWDIQGRVGELKNPLLHYPHANISQFLRHINFYSTLRAQELNTSRTKTSIFQVIFYPIGKFMRLWIWELGFMDGNAGFIHAMTIAFYSFLVRGKLWLLRS